MELNIRLKHPETYPYVGQFTDAVDFKAAKAPVRMFKEFEDIKEDPDEVDDVVKDAEYYRKMAKDKKLRRSYRRKEILKLEDSLEREEGDAPFGLIFEGEKHAPNNGVEVVPEYRNFNHIKAEASKEFTNQYAIMQVVKRKGKDGAKDETEVNLVPLAGFYNFKKPADKNQSMQVINDEFEAEQERRRRGYAKFESMVARDPEEVEAAKARAAAAEGISVKKLGRPKAKVYEEGVKVGSGTYELPAMFGMNLQKAKFKKMATQSNMDEGGVDHDAGNAAEEEFKGDYDKTNADDDAAFADEGVQHAQQEEENMYNNDMAKNDRFAEEEDPVSDSDEEEEDEEDNEEEKPVVSMVDGGAVDEQTMMEARTAKRLLNMGNLTSTSTSGADDGTGKGGGKKRGREEVDASPEAKKAKGAVAEGLTEKEMRSFLNRPGQGGKASMDDLKTHFRKQVKAMNKEKKDSGKAAITDLVRRLCVVGDSVAGKIVTLKK